METKLCSQCKTQKSVDEFYRRSDGRINGARCKECHKAAVRARAQRDPEAYSAYQKARRALPGEREKAAERIKAWREADPERYRESKRVYAASHREQIREYRKKWRAANPDRYQATLRKKKLKQRFGLTIEQYEDLLGRQSGVCAICHAEASKNGYRLAVDHDAVTGEIRGILCRHCNLAIGNLDHDARRAASAAAYLLQSGTGLFLPEGATGK